MKSLLERACSCELLDSIESENGQGQAMYLPYRGQRGPLGIRAALANFPGSHWALSTILPIAIILLSSIKGNSFYSLLLWAFADHVRKSHSPSKETSYLPSRDKSSPRGKRRTAKEACCSKRGWASFQGLGLSSGARAR